MTYWPDIPEDDSSLAAEYALGLLAAVERRAVEARLAVEPALRAELRAWDEALVPMAAEIAPVMVPARVGAALERRLFGTVPRRGLFGRLSFWRGLSGVALAGLAALAILLAAEIRPVGEQEQAPAYVAEVRGAESDLRLSALFDPGTGALRVNRAAGAVPEDGSLQLWMIEGGAAPVSLGLLPVDRRGRVSIPPELAERLPDATLAVSAEPEGGSPTGSPTTVLGTGAVTPL